MSLSAPSAPLETDPQDIVQPATPAPGPEGEAPLDIADRDGDGFSDSLRAALDAADSGAMFDVVVIFDVPGRAADIAEQAVGPFVRRREFQVIRGFAATMTAAQALALGRTPGVHRIEEDFLISVNLNGARQDFGSEDVRIDLLVDGSGAILGRPVGICVIDTGIDPTHEQLDNGKIVDFFDAINGLTTAYDDHGHGSHVANIAAGDGIGGVNASSYSGVAPGAALYGAKVLDSTGSGSDSEVIAGVEWCAGQANVDILSMSLGTPGGSDGQDALSAAANCTADPNWSPVCGPAAVTPKIVVIAAGNSGPGPETVGAPGAAEKAITVGAVANPSDDGRGVYLAAFSSRGPTLDGRLKPDITAPGVRITAADISSRTGYVSKSGTSMAAPFVSGVVALMVDANPDLRLTDSGTGQQPVDRIRDILQATAQDRGPDGPTGEAKDNEYGFGLIDAYSSAAEASGLSTGAYQATRFPAYHRETATVAANGEWFSQPFEVPGDGTPLAATITIEGNAVCTLGGILCDLLGVGWEWNPDLDLQILDAVTGAPVSAAGSDITMSECALAGEYCGVSRQETVYFLPSGPGSYRFRVYSISDGGDFALEVSGLRSPMVAAAGPDQVVTDNDADNFETFVLDASASSHSSGTIVSYEWFEAESLIATGINPTVVLAVGSHDITLTLTDDLGDTVSDTLLVTVSANQTPVADAGPNQTVADNDATGTEMVTLDGGASSDPGGGTIVSYVWSESGLTVGTGQTVNLALGLGLHDLTLTVTDNGGAVAVDTVGVTVLANQSPVADAGPDQAVTDNDGDAIETATLDGSASHDPGGGTLVSYEWTQAGNPVGSGQILNLPLGIGVHNFTLTVTDQAGITNSDTVVVTLLANQAPLANAGPDQQLVDNDGNGSETFTLNGGGSNDPGGGTIVSYEWSEGGAVIGTGASLTLSRDFGVYSFTLTVTDEAGASASDSVVITVDPDSHLANVVLLTHLDGADGATTALDESNSSHVLTFAGNAQIDTSQSKFGGASAMFDDLDNSFVSAADSDDWHFGAGEFTVEGWVRFSSLGTYSPIIGQLDGTTQQSWRLDWTTAHQLRFLYSPDGTDASRVNLVAAWTPAVDTWYHIAVDRDSSKRLRVYVDGAVLIDTVVSVGFHNSTADLKIGERHAGWIDEVRITKGVAQYAGAFIAPDQPYPVPGTAMVAVPDVTGMDQLSAETTIGDMGLETGAVTTAASETVLAGDVISQSPTGGISVAEGSSVDLIVSSGTIVVSVPDVIGLDETSAETMITASGLVVGTVSASSSESVPAGDVLSQDPLGGSNIAEGGTVDLVVSSGPAILLVPDVVGLDQSSAEAAISGAGLLVGTVTTSSRTALPIGDVISQNPAGGSSVAEGSTVDLVVSSGPAGETLHVGDLDAAVKNAGKTWKVKATITVDDSNHATTSDVTVNGIWSGAYSGSGSCVTNGKGSCSLTSGSLPLGIGAVIFTVTSLDNGASTYQSADNHDADGDSDGSSVAISN